jgi:uncharacterized protein (TIGR02001 family)
MNRKKAFAALFRPLCLATLTLSGTVQALDVDISPIVDISNMYLYRGEDLGGGDAQVSGGVRANAGGFYTGVWATSASDGEYDLYLGTAYDLGRDFSVDVSVWTYTYPHVPELDAPGQSSEVFLTLAWKMLSFTAVDNIAGNAGYNYFAIAGSYQQFSATLGLGNPDTTRNVLSNDPTLENYAGNADVDYVHLDLTYAYNDRLRFTVSQIVAQDDLEIGETKYEDLHEDATLFALAYSIPLD